MPRACTIRPILIAALALACVLAQLPRHAIAAASTTWTYVGRHIVYNYYSSVVEPGASMSSNSLTEKISYGEPSEDFPWGYTYVGSCTWELPPDSIDVGHEHELKIKCNASIGSYNLGARYEEANPIYHAVGESVWIKLFQLPANSSPREGSASEDYLGESIDPSTNVECGGTTVFEGVQFLASAQLFPQGTDPDDINSYGNSVFATAFKTDAKTDVVWFTPTDAWNEAVQQVAQTPGTYLLMIQVDAGLSHFYHEELYYTFSSDGTGVATNQDETIVARDKPGTEQTVIESSIFSIFDPTKGGKVLYPLVGAAVAGGIGYKLLKGRRKKDGSPGGNTEPEEDDEPQTVSTFRMLFSKKFGNQLQAGGPEREVFFRIEEEITYLKTGKKTKRNRDELTAKITVTPERNVEVRSTKLVVQAGQPAWMRASITAPKDAKRNVPPEISATYVGPGGTFQQHVVFQLMDAPYITRVDAQGKLVAERADLLAGDKLGTHIYVAVNNLVDPPKRLSVSQRDAHLTVEGKPYTKVKRQDTYFYDLTVCNDEPIDSPFGTWPLERGFTVKVTTKQDEVLELRLRMNLWPEGFSVDTRKVKPEWVHDKRIVLDTGDLLSLSGTTTLAERVADGSVDYVIRPVRLGLGFAYKDERGEVVVDHPNRPENLAFPRLEPANADSYPAFSRDSPRFWYRLEFRGKPLGSEFDRRTGSLELTPLFPMVVKDSSKEYSACFVLGYDGSGLSENYRLDFGFKGINEQQHETDRKAVLRSINRLLSVMQTHNMDEVWDVFYAYGPDAEQARRKLGDDKKELIRLGRTSENIMAEIGKIQSVQRLIFIRDTLLHVGAEALANDGVSYDLCFTKVQFSWQTVGNYYRFLYYSSLFVRWTVDMTLSACWYIMFKDKGRYVEPLMTPLYGHLTKYAEKYGLWYFDEDEEYVSFKEYMLDTKNILHNVAMPAFENFLCLAMVEALATGGMSLLKDPRVYEAFGGMVVYFFAKNCEKAVKLDPNTGKKSFDLWKILRATMGDVTVFSMKVVVSALLARGFKKLVEGLRESQNIFGEGLKLGSSDALKNTTNPAGIGMPALGVAEGGPIGKLYQFFDSFCKSLVQGGRAVKQGHAIAWTGIGNLLDATTEKQMVETMGVLADFGITGGIELVSSEIRENIPDAPNPFDQAKQLWGTIAVTYTDEQGNEKTSYLPLLATVCRFVNYLFRTLKIDEAKAEVDEVFKRIQGRMPEWCPTLPQNEMVKVMQTIPGGEKEVEFLTSPELANGPQKR